MKGVSTLKDSEFKQAVEKALDDLIKSPEFKDVAEDNWRNNKGREEELYPFFYELLRRYLGCEIRGLGYGRVKNMTEKIDCLCYFQGNSCPFGIELKGPSKKKSWSDEHEKDLDRLNTFVRDKKLSYGIAVGISLLEQSDSCVHKITLDSEQICVDLKIKDTNEQNPADAI